ncbi:ribonuclease H protein, partial [Trifolium medium]|nr:ribonuclease H protein [Trifolium medium]
SKHFIRRAYGGATWLTNLLGEWVQKNHLLLRFASGAVNLIREGVSVHHRFANKIFSIQQLVDKDWDVVVEHTLREGNACADVLAKMGALSDSPLVKITSPPSELSMPLLANAHGVVFIRE